jgi:DNA-binding GntR family transcriptional regulator
MANSRSPGVTLATAAYERLRADLLSCRLPPGEPIKIADTAAAFGTNPIAVREALSKLTSEGLVTTEAQKGFRAAPISIAALCDLTQVRIEIEGLCLRRSIATGGVDWESGIVATLHRLLRTDLVAADDVQRNSENWALHHGRYHEALVAACDSPILLSIRTSLFAQSERYRRLSVPLAETVRDLDGEHSRLADAVIRRDADLAVALMTAHLNATTKILIDSGLVRHEPASSNQPCLRLTG